MSPKNPGAPKKPRWSQAKKAAARRAGTSGPRPERKPQRPGRDDRRSAPARDGDRYSAGRGRPRRDDERSFRSEDRADRPRRYDERSERPRYDDRGGRPRRDADRRPDGAGRRDDRGGWNRGRPDRENRSFDRRDDRGADRREDRRSFDRRDDRGGDRRSFDRRDDRSFDRRDDRRSFDRRDDRRSFDRGSDRRHDGRSFDRRDDRRSFDRRDDRGFDRRDDRRSFDRRDDRGFDRRDDRRSFDRRDDRRPFDRRDDRGYDRRDDRSRSEGYARTGDRQERFSRDERYPRRDQRDEGAAEHVETTRRDEARDRRENRDHHRAPHDTPSARREQLQRKEAPAPEPVDLETNGFAALGLPEAVVRRLARDGVTAPFPIQEATIPDALAGRDVLGRGRTGSGKTYAFGLPLLTRLAEGEKAQPHQPKAIVLSPTRELAMQISDALQPLVHVLGLRHKLVAGGMPYPPQFDALERGVDVLVATPGRLNDLIERGACSLEGVEIVVIDEADHMADMGFLPEVTAIMDLVPAGGQRLLFSATLDNGIDTLVESYLQDPVTHSTDDAQAAVTTMAHHVLLVEPAHKKVVTAHVANRGGHTIVFCRTKLGADRVAAQLREQGVFAAALHGGLGQGARNRVLGAFRDGTLPVLVATDVAARGIHVDDVGVVLQVDPPQDHKDYLHRAGRTARAGEQGTVVTLALPHQKRLMKRISEQAGLDVEPERVAPGDDRLHELTGAQRPGEDPIPEERLRRLMEPPPRPRRGGYRGGRPGGGRQGGYRGGRDGGRGGRQGGGRYRD